MRDFLLGCVIGAFIMATCWVVTERLTPKAHVEPPNVTVHVHTDPVPPPVVVVPPEPPKVVPKPHPRPRRAAPPEWCGYYRCSDLEPWERF